MIAPYRQFMLLAPGPGWQAQFSGLTAHESGELTLDPLPGAPAPVAALSSLTEQRPVALCMPANGPLHILCAEGARIHVAPHGCESSIRAIPGIGRLASGERRLRKPQDIAISHHGELIVADPIDRSIKIFSAFPYALLAVWRHVGRPVRLALTGDDDIWVLDADGRRAIRLDRDGVVRRTVEGLTDPRDIAAGDGALAVLDGDEVRCYLPRAAQPTVLGAVADGCCLCFGADQTLYVGSVTGLVQVFARTSEGWRSAGVGVLGQTAAIRRLAWQGGSTLYALVAPEGETRAQVWTIDAEADHAREASFATDELDSGIANCVWHRIALDADIPEGTAIDVSTETYERAGENALADLTPAAIILTGAQRDCLVQKGVGRYLTLRLRLRGNGTATPALRGVRIWFPRDGWLNALPAVYQEDPESAAFLDRLLSILQTAYDGFDEAIDDIWKLFDARSVPDRWFNWLASWVALPINPHWTNAQRRAVLRNAFRTYRRRGTPGGLEVLVGDYAGVGARIVEHFKLRPWIRLTDDPDSAVPTGGGRLWSGDAYRRWQVGHYSQVGEFKLSSSPEPGLAPLDWGANRFSVYFDAAPLTVDTTRKSVLDVVEREKPAHTQAFYRPVYARMRVGVQATLGVDTRVGDIGQAVLGRISTLGYDSILACRSMPGSSGRAARTRPRLDVNARLH